MPAQPGTKTPYRDSIPHTAFFVVLAFTMNRVARERGQATVEYRSKRSE